MVAASVAGCGSASKTAKSSSGGVEKANLTIGAIQSVSAAGLYIAEQRGLFAQQGLHVTIQATASSGTSMTTLLSGAQDISFGNYVSYILAQDKHTADLKIIAPGYDSGPHGFEVLAPRGSPLIGNPQKLRGKTIGVNALNNIAVLLIEAKLKMEGVPLNSVKFVAYPFPEMAQALAEHRIDAGWETEPYLTDAESVYGDGEVFDSDDNGGTQNFPISGYAITASFAKKYPKTVAAFVRAITKAQQIATSDIGAVQAVLPKYTGIPAKVANVISIGTFPTVVAPAELNRVTALLQQLGWTPSQFNVGPMIDDVSQSHG